MEILILIGLVALVFYFIGKKSNTTNDRTINADIRANRVKINGSYIIEYSDRDGVITEREITPVSIKRGSNPRDDLIIARCHLRGGERSFYNSRVMRCTHKQSGQDILNLARHLRNI